MSWRSAPVVAPPASMASMRWRAIPDALDSCASVISRLRRMAQTVLANSRLGSLESTAMMMVLTIGSSPVGEIG